MTKTKKDLIYEDDSGNRLMKDVDNRLIILSKRGKLIHPIDAKRFLSNIPVQIAMKRYFGDIPYIKILNHKQTYNIRKKVNGGIY